MNIDDLKEALLASFCAVFLALAFIALPLVVLFGVTRACSPAEQTPVETNQVQAQRPAEDTVTDR